MKSYEELKSLIERRGVHPVFGGSGEDDWNIEQSAEELAEFLVHMQERGIVSVLEIGTGYRAGLARFLHDDMGYTVTSVDIHDYGHTFAGVTFVTGTGSVEGYYDLVIIDADHSYEGVKRDHETWALHATKVIAFHDIAGLRDCEGVRTYWAEIARDAHWEKNSGVNELVDPLKPGYYEIIAEGDQRGGIGYMVLAEAKAAFERELAELEAANPLPEIDMPPPPKTTRKPAAKKPAARKAAVKK